MTTLVEIYTDVVHSGYPFIREKFLFRSPMPMVTIITAYVLFVKYIGPAIMKHRKPFQMRRLMIFYNACLVIYYTYFLAKGCVLAYRLGFSTFCDSTLDPDIPIVVEFLNHGYSAYVLRYFELIDTIFLVLAKKFKMITTLHVFHHAIVPVFGWFGFRSERSAYLSAFIGLNSFVHIVMYTYYAIAALGPEYQKYIWWKKYLTTLQICQFLLMTLYLLFMSAIGCTTSKLTLVFCVFLTVLFFFLFTDYYKRTFNEAQKKEICANGESRRNSATKNKNN